MAVGVGRNDTCPCGSGRKYKKCCLPIKDGVSPIHDVDNKLRPRIMEYSSDRFPKSAFAEATGVPVAEDTLPIFIPWMLYHHVIDGSTVAAWFGKERADSLSEVESAWLQAQADTPISIWKVLQVMPGRDVVLEDVLCGQCCTVHDVAASRSLKPLHHVLARVTGYQEASVITGSHPHTLSPFQAFAVREAFLQSLGRDAGAGDLRTGSTTLKLLRLWDGAVQAAMRPPTGLPSNTDGDALELTAMTFSFAPEHRAAIIDALLVPNSDCVTEKVDDSLLVISRQTVPRPGQWTGTVLATVMVKPGALEVHTNSEARAISCREFMVNVTGHQLTYVSSTPIDMGAYTQALHKAAPRQAPSIDGGMDAMRLFKTQHYQSWMDEAIPFLAGESPRQAAQSTAGRARVLALLDDMEYRELQEPLLVRHDFSPMRRELGL